MYYKTVGNLQKKRDNNWENIHLQVTGKYDLNVCHVFLVLPPWSPLSLLPFVSLFFPNWGTQFSGWDGIIEGMQNHTHFDNIYDYDEEEVDSGGKRRGKMG